MVDNTHRMIEATRRRITFSYRVALSLVAIMVVLTAAITGHLVRDQIDDTSIINISGKQRMLSQRIAFLTHELTEVSEQTRSTTLQALHKAADEMESAHTVLTTYALAHTSIFWYDSFVDDMYFQPPLQLDAQMQAFLGHVHHVLRLTPEQVKVNQPDVAAIIREAQGRLLESLDAVVSQDEQETVERFQMLYNIVLGLSGAALLMLVGVAMVVLRPAILYVEQAQRRLQELNQLKGDFLANMSHEIRTPMNGIFGMTELLTDSALNPRQQHYVRTLQNSADHLLGLINDILDFSKLEAGQMKLDPIHFNLMATIEDVLEVLSMRAREKNLELLLRYAPGTPSFIVADPGRIRQVLFNLLGNAIKFTDQGYVMVHVELLSKDSAPDRKPWLRVRVEDTGIGIPENKINGLFEKFMQVESGSTRARQGTGLGLAISRNLVTLMGGDISVASTPGLGTIFTWMMPLPEEGTQPVTTDYNAALVGRRLLLVDDLAPNRLLYKETLMMAGAVCLVAENAREALSILAYEQENARVMDAVLTDFMMPGIDGLQLATRIREDVRFKHLPIIMLSSMGEQGLIKRFDEAGVNACLSKPATRQQLIDTLVHVLDAASRGVKYALITAESSSALSVNRLMSRERALHGTHILLVEDNRVNLEITSEMLTRFGCQVNTAESGLEALDQVRQHAFDLIFMDCQMPEMDGFEAARHIVSMKAAGEIAPVPVVALTANALKGDRERCLEAGMDDYLSKPVRKASLEAILLKWLRQKLEQPNGGESLEAQDAPPVPPRAATLPGAMPGIDSTAFNNAQEMLGDKLGTVISYYLEDAENFINRIAEAVERNDPDAAVLPAHTLKSSSRQLGATELADLAARAEINARNSAGGVVAEDIAALVVPMRAALGQLRPFFESASAA
ncbi:MAG: response regulator [Pseudomonadota bacterium]